ncbi:MAG: PEP/pyruvate-binding domain-containing protein [Verrucomicrobiales bacterium]
MNPPSPSPVKTSHHEIGGKAATLVDLQLAGFQVPEFLCTTDASSAVATLGLPLAVRSSASAEDGRQASFAGQFRSFLNLQSVDEVQTAIGRCLASLGAEAVANYCRHHGLDPRSLRMTVIVQRMIQPELSGVAFTVNPATGSEEVVVEACEGVGEALMAGHAAALPPDHPILRRHAAEITRLARDIQRHFGTPQDIEFAVQDERVFILQARPVTRIQFAPGTGEWTNADFRDGGVSSGVCTPLMWSLYDFIWEDALKGFLRDIRLFRGDFPAGRVFFGRPYWNLGAVKHCLARLPGFVEREFDRDLGVEPAYDGDGKVTPVTLRGVLRALPTIAAIPAVWRRQERVARELLDGGFDRLTSGFRTIPDDPVPALQQLVEFAYRTVETEYFRTIYCASLAKLAFLESFPDADYPALVSALPEMRHLDPTRAMRAMVRRGECDPASFQQAFAHRSRRELDIRAPRWDEDPEWVRQMIEHAGTEPPADPQPAYLRARVKAMAALPRRKRRSFERKLDRLRTFLWLREEMRDLSSRMYHLIRRHVLAVARQRRLGDDIFFMTFGEILADNRSGIPRARETYEAFRNFKAPNEIRSGMASRVARQNGELTGTAASRGVVRGTARIARSIEEAMTVERGAVLICPFTDPGWTPVLDRVAAVVTETGGLLSHAAVICREFALPAVLGVPDATSRIPQGATVVVDGQSGVVTIESAAPSLRVECPVHTPVTSQQSATAS